MTIRTMSMYLSLTVNHPQNPRMKSFLHQITHIIGLCFMLQCMFDNYLNKLCLYRSNTSLPGGIVVVPEYSPLYTSGGIVLIYALKEMFTNPSILTYLMCIIATRVNCRNFTHKKEHSIQFNHISGQLGYSHNFKILNTTNNYASTLADICICVYQYDQGMKHSYKYYLRELYMNIFYSVLVSSYISVIVSTSWYYSKVSLYCRYYNAHMHLHQLKSSVTMLYSPCVSECIYNLLYIIFSRLYSCRLLPEALCIRPGILLQQARSLQRESDTLAHPYSPHSRVPSRHCNPDIFVCHVLTWWQHLKSKSRIYGVNVSIASVMSVSTTVCYYFSTCDAKATRVSHSCTNTGIHIYPMIRLCHKSPGNRKLSMGVILCDVFGRHTWIPGCEICVYNLCVKNNQNYRCQYCLNSSTDKRAAVCKCDGFLMHHFCLYKGMFVNVTSEDLRNTSPGPKVLYGNYKIVYSAPVHGRVYGSVKHRGTLGNLHDDTRHCIYNNEFNTTETNCYTYNTNADELIHCIYTNDLFTTKIDCCMYNINADEFVYTHDSIQTVNGYYVLRDAVLDTQRCEGLL